MFNPDYSYEYYEGYTYNTGYRIYTKPQTNSAIKSVVDNWYNTNLVSYENYLSGTAIYCNDRSSLRAPGGDYRYYPAYDRLVTNKRPTSACLSTNASRYTISEETGNGYLTYPISLLTADEVSYSGLIYNSSGTGSLNSYIMDNAKGNWWSLTPYYINQNYYSYVYLFNISSTGYLYFKQVNTAYSVRPAISLKPCVTTPSGDGSFSSPYELSDKSC